LAIDNIYHEGKVGETYNIGGDNEWTNLDLVKKLCDIMDKKLGQEIGTSQQLITFVKDRAGHDLRYAIDASKIENELGWKPSIQFEEGFEQTIDWYLSNTEWMKHMSSGDYEKYYEQQYVNR
jgi:dTDP-glucose 4,6-dehydratase